MDISHTDQFLALDENEMNWILDNEDIKVSEAAILVSLAQWYKHSESQREKAFKELFVKVQRSVINKDVLSVIINKYQLVKVLPELREYKKLKSKRVDAVERLIHKENIANIAVLGFQTLFIRPTPNIDQLQREARFSYWMPMTSKVASFNAILVQPDILYTFEFYNPIPVQHDIFIFGWSPMVSVTLGALVKVDCNTRTVTECAPLSRPIYSTNSLLSCLYIQCGIFIYLLGGYLCRWQTKFKTVYRYDMVNDEWKELQPINNGHSSFSADVVCNNNRYLYVFGVYSSERYDMCTNTWNSLIPPWEESSYDTRFRDRPRSVSASVLNNKIFVRFEKKYKSCRLYIYDPTTDTWQKVGKSKDPCIDGKYFGENFVVRGDRIRRWPYTLSFSAFNSDSCEEKKMALLKYDIHRFTNFQYITVISRGGFKHLLFEKMSATALKYWS